MNVSRIEDFKLGWIIGDFEPSLLRTKDFEACYRFHKKGEVCGKHYHKLGTEYNVLIEGKMILQGKTIQTGDVFVINPYEIADPEFIEDCKVMIIKVPSSPKDKYFIE